MSKLLTYATVDGTIQKRMSGNAPDSSVRLDVMNDVAQELQAKYNIEQTKRSVSISVIAIGSTAYLLSGLVTDDDVKQIDELRFSTDDAAGESYFRYVTYEEFMQHLADSVRINEYTTYFVDGLQYIRVNSRENDTSAITLTMVYWSFFVSMDSSNDFQEKITATDDDLFLLPTRFKELFVSRCLSDLWRIALGSAGDTESALANNKYKSELKKLGLDDTSRKIKNKQRSLKIHSQY